MAKSQNPFAGLFSGLADFFTGLGVNPTLFGQSRGGIDPEMERALTREFAESPPFADAGPGVSAARLRAESEANRPSGGKGGVGLPRGITRTRFSPQAMDRRAEAAAGPGLVRFEVGGPPKPEGGGRTVTPAGTRRSGGSRVSAPRMIGARADEPLGMALAAIQNTLSRFPAQSGALFETIGATPEDGDLFEQRVNEIAQQAMSDAGGDPELAGVLLQNRLTDAFDPELAPVTSPEDELFLALIDALGAGFAQPEVEETETEIGPTLDPRFTGTPFFFEPV